MLIHLSAGERHVKINGLTFQKGTLSYHTEDDNVSVSYLEKEIITYTDYTLFLIDEAAVSSLSELTEWMDGHFFYDASFDGGLQEVTDIGNITTHRIVQVNNGILKESTNNPNPEQISPSTWTIHRPLEWSCWLPAVTGAIYIKLPITGVVDGSNVYRIRGQFRHGIGSGAVFHMTEFEIHVLQNLVLNTRTPVYLSNNASDAKILPVRLIHNGSDVRIVLGNITTSHISSQCVIEEIVGRRAGMGDFEMGIITSFDGYTVIDYPADTARYQATQDWVTAQTNLQQVTARGNRTTIPIAKLSALSGAHGQYINSAAQRQLYNPTGAIAIKHAPIQNTSIRLKIDISAFATILATYEVSFTRQTSTAAIYNPKAMLITNNMGLTSLVRVSHDINGNVTVLIGDITTNWGNSFLDIRADVSANWTNGQNLSWSNGWSIELETDLSAYSTLFTAPIENFATQSWILTQGFLTSISNLQQVTTAGNTTSNSMVLNDNATLIKNSSSAGVKDTIRFNTTETKGRIAFEQTGDNGANFKMFLKHGSSAENEVMSIDAEDSGVRFKTLEGSDTRQVTALPDGTLSTSFTGLGTQLLTGSASLAPGIRNVVRFDGSANNYDLTLPNPVISPNETITITNANGNTGGNINFAGSYLPYYAPSNQVTVLTPGSHVVIKSILISGTWTWIRVQS